MDRTAPDAATIPPPTSGAVVDAAALRLRRAAERIARQSMWADHADVRDRELASRMHDEHRRERPPHY